MNRRKISERTVRAEAAEERQRKKKIRKQASSNTGILLPVVSPVLRPSASLSPGVAALLDRIERANRLRDFALPFEHLQCKSYLPLAIQSAQMSVRNWELTRAGMPSNVAMHQPDTRVVRLEGKHKVTAGLQHGDVATRRVAKGKVLLRINLGRVEETSAALDDGEVVAVQMDGMGAAKHVGRAVARVDDHVDEAIGVLRIVCNNRQHDCVCERELTDTYRAQRRTRGSKSCCRGVAAWGQRS